MRPKVPCLVCPSSFSRLNGHGCALRALGFLTREPSRQTGALEKGTFPPNGFRKRARPIRSGTLVRDRSGHLFLSLVGDGRTYEFAPVPPKKQ